jgi:branched-chain amino acid transport system substrate-binding protein
MRKFAFAVTIATAIATASAHAQTQTSKYSDNVIRIGVLNDRSGPYADLSGEGSAIAARMASEEFGNKVNRDGRPSQQTGHWRRNRSKVV